MGTLVAVLVGCCLAGRQKASSLNWPPIGKFSKDSGSVVLGWHCESIYCWTSYSSYCCGQTEFGKQTSHHLMWKYHDLVTEKTVQMAVDDDHSQEGAKSLSSHFWIMSILASKDPHDYGFVYFTFLSSSQASNMDKFAVMITSVYACVKYNFEHRNIWCFFPVSLLCCTFQLFLLPFLFPFCFPSFSLWPYSRKNIVEETNRNVFINAGYFMEVHILLYKPRNMEFLKIPRALEIIGGLNPHWSQEELRI